ncbi:MAG: hypothetical protein ACYSUY_03645 [Planctomycetota bacterium]|jgi:hypothetical protein
MRNLKLTLFIVVLIVGWFGGFNAAQAQIITGVMRGGSSTNPPPIIAPNSLDEDKLCFVDRPHQYNSIPIDLLGAEYVMVSNDDKTQADFSLNVTLSQPARLYLFLDNRLGHGATVGGDPNMNPDLWAAGMGWVYTNGFTDTGLNIGIDEGGDGQINQWASAYVRKSQAGTFTLFQQNDFTNPTGRNMYGVAALMPKLFEAFWVNNGTLNLAQTPDLVTVSSGFHAGPEWFWDDHNWHSPLEIEDNSWGVSKWRPYFESPFFWDVDEGEGGDDSWHGSGPWSFVTHLELQYTDPNVYSIHRWFFFWGNEPNGKGNCMEVTTGDIGGLSSPLNITIIDDNLVIRNHRIIVNTEIRNVFSDLEFIPIDSLEDRFRESMPERDWPSFMSGGAISHLKITDPCGQGHVGVQRTSWTHPPTPILLSAESLEVEATDGVISYEVSLPEPPVNPVTVNLKKIGPAIKWADYDDDVNPTLVFDQRNYNKPQVVKIAVHDDGWNNLRSIAAKLFEGRWGKQGYQTFVGNSAVVENPAGGHFFDTWVSHGRIAHYLDGDPTEIALLPVTVMDKREHAPTDINRDTITNLVDVAYVANAFLESTEQPQLFAPLTNPDEFTGVDIGIDGGSASFDPQTGTWIVTADGADIWSTSDQFHYVYNKTPPGDYQLTVTVNSLENTHVWAKAGIMIRQGLNPSEPHVSIYVTPERGVVFQCRPQFGAETWSEHGGITAHHKAPVSLRLMKAGDTVTGLVYTEGSWKGVFSMPIPPPDPAYPAYIGMAVTSHVEGTPTIATFGSELVSLGPQPEPPD